MNQYNVWNKWNKLKTVMLGDHYYSEFFNDIKNAKIRSALQRISDETHEDLDYYETVLKNFGCNVIRPHVDKKDSIMNYIDNEGKVIRPSSGVPRSPLQARDAQFVAGNKLFFTTIEKGVHQKLNEYNSKDTIDLLSLKDFEIHKKYRPIKKEKFNNLKKYINLVGTYEEYKNESDYFDRLDGDTLNFVKNMDIRGCDHVNAPSYTIVGRDLYIDQFDFKLRDDQLQILKENIPNVRVNTLNHGGHSDGCFHTLKPGAILSILDIQNYKHTFPGWDICYLPGESWGKVSGFIKLKNQVNGKWWVPGEEENDEFTHFVETWLQDWVGYVEESVFDVNVLVLDEHHVCVNNMNPTVIEFLKKHRMEPVHVPWRHRYFLDGGLHCITLDLEREGSQEDYFPERGNAGVIDHGFD